MLAELLMSASSIHSTSVDGGTTLWAPEAAKLHIWGLFRNFDSFPYLATNGLLLKTPLCKRRWSQCVHLSLILQPWQTLASEVVDRKQTQLAVSETANGSISYVFVTFHYESISFMPVGVTLKRKAFVGFAACDWLGVCCEFSQARSRDALAKADHIDLCINVSQCF